jgi:hypothetical protein
MGSFGDADKGLASYRRVAQTLRGTAPPDILPAAFAKLAAGMNPTDVRFWGSADMSRHIFPIISDAIGPGADIRPRVKRFWLGSLNALMSWIS